MDQVNANQNELQLQQQKLQEEKKQEEMADALLEKFNITQELQKMQQEEVQKKTEGTGEQPAEELPKEVLKQKLDAKREGVALVMDLTMPKLEELPVMEEKKKAYKKNKRQQKGETRAKMKAKRKEIRKVQKEAHLEQEFHDLIEVSEADKKLEEVLKADYLDEQGMKIETGDLVDLDKMKQEHTTVMEMRLKKHNIVKPDEYELQPVVAEKEEKVAIKRQNAARLMRDVNMCTDEAVRFRTKVPMSIKKNLDYKTFSDVNDATLGMDAKTSNKVMNMMAQYGKLNWEANDLQKPNPRMAAKNREYATKNCLFPAMDILAKRIMEFDYLNTKISTDNEMAENALKLEMMSKNVQAFMALMAAHPEYMDHVMDRKLKKVTKGTKGEKVDDVTYGERLMKRLDLLNAMSDYYRVRKLIMEDETYIEHANEEIEYEEREGDAPQMKHVKKLMRSSFYLAQNLSRELGNENAMPKWFNAGAKEVTLLRSKVDYDKVEEKDGKRDITLLRGYIDEKMSGYQDHQKRMYELENTRYMIAPLWMNSALSIDPAKQVKKQREKGTWTASGHNAFDMQLQADDIKYRKREGFVERFMKLGKKKTGKHWGGAPKFYGKDKYLADLTPSDNWDRIFHAISTEYAYRRTDAEVMEMADLLTTQKDKSKYTEVSGKAEGTWKDNVDPQEQAFYESAYKEMAMKLIFSIQCSAARQAETFGMDALLLHPVDLFLQMTPQIRSIMMTNSIISNVDSPENLTRLTKLFQENNKDGRYSFDTQRFHDYSCVVTSVNGKLQFLTNAFKDVLINDRQKDCKAMFGHPNFYDEVMLKAAEKAVKEGDPTAKGLDVSKFDEVMGWFFDQHPEYLTQKTLNTKQNGKAVLAEHLNGGFGFAYSKNEEGISDAMAKGYVKTYTKEQIDAYEKSLRDRKFVNVRDQCEDDDPEDMVRFDEGEDVIMTPMSKILENRAADPFGLDFIRNDFAELKYTDKNGKQKMRFTSRQY